MEMRNAYKNYCRFPFMRMLITGYIVIPVHVISRAYSFIQQVFLECTPDNHYIKLLLNVP